MDYDIIVVGGGAAGLMAGGFAAKTGARVLIAEKMDRPARKILVTGKGRCNVTNNCDPETFITMMCSNPYFMYGPIYSFPPEDTMELFEELGVPLKTERGNRVYPTSENAMDIADALVHHAKKNGCEIKELEVDALLLSDGKVNGIVTKKGEKFTSQKVLIATGGLSYPGTGSTGDGYALAKQVGHKIVPPRASLSALNTKEQWHREAKGLSLRNIELSLHQRNVKKPIYIEQGEMLFTHFGVSGPLILTASTHMDKPIWNYSITVDLKPALSEEQLDERLLRDFAEFANRDFGNALDKLLPQSLIPIMIDLSEIPHYTKVHQITREQRLKILKLLKELPITPESLRPVQQAVVTAGGVDVKDIDPATMASKLVENLYFAGEVVDLDAVTGGFNLQIAFSTGYVAGTSCGNAVKESVSRD